MLAMIRKEFAQLRRDRRTAAMLVVIPLLMLVVFGYAARFDVEVVRTVVVGDPSVAELLPEVFDIREVHDADTDPVDLLRHEDVDAAVVTATRTVEVDGTQQFAAQQVLAIAAASGGAFTAEVHFNPDLSTTVIMVPALVGLIMLFIGALATSLGVVRERQTGTLEQLAVMPFSPTDLFVALLDLAVILTVGLTLFDVPFDGSPLLFGIGAALFLFVALSIGVLISTVSENQGQAVQLALMVLLPQIMLSGLIFPIESMAVPLRTLALAFPLTWFIQIARGVMVRGAELSHVGVPLAVLTVMGVIVFAAAIRRFSRDLAGADT